MLPSVSGATLFAWWGPEKVQILWGLVLLKLLSLGSRSHLLSKIVKSLFLSQYFPTWILLKMINFFLQKECVSLLILTPPSTIEIYVPILDTTLYLSGSFQSFLSLACIRCRVLTSFYIGLFKEIKQILKVLLGISKMLNPSSAQDFGWSFREILKRMWTEYT